MPISPEVHAAVRALTDQPLVGVLDSDLIADTENLYKLATAISAQALRRLAEIDARGLAPDAGAPTTAAWLTARLQMNHGPARRQVRLARALTEHPQTAAALAGATITVEHAQVITQALDALPATVDDATLQAAEDTLVAEAGRPRPDGSVDGVFWLDPALGAQLRALIDAGCAPRPSTAAGPDPRTAGRRRHDTLADLLRQAVARPEPVPGQGRPTLAVTITLKDLRAGLPGRGHDGAVIDPAVVRRLACDAGIIPIVLGSRSQVLDIGRRSRTVPAGIRTALIHRDQGCAFPGCDRPDSWTDAHHIRHWSQGGHTAVSNLVLLCGHHHRTIHHRGWTVQIDDHGLPDFTPPPWLRHAYGTAA